MPGQGQSSRWIACRRSDLLWRCWDGGESVIYHVASGDTHLLNEVAAAALQVLEHHPRSSHELAEHLAREFGHTCDAQFQEQVAHLVIEFDELGLIEPVP